jgi:hypothetical protein
MKDLERKGHKVSGWSEESSFTEFIFYLLSLIEEERV